MDFSPPQNLGFTCHDRANADKPPIVTHERFIGFLNEQDTGNFPLWLALDQLRVITIGAHDDPAPARTAEAPHGARSVVDVAAEILAAIRGRRA